MSEARPGPDGDLLLRVARTWAGLPLAEADVPALLASYQAMAAGCATFPGEAIRDLEPPLRAVVPTLAAEARG